MKTQRCMGWKFTAGAGAAEAAKENELELPKAELVLAAPAPKANTPAAGAAVEVTEQADATVVFAVGVAPAPKDDTLLAPNVKAGVADPSVEAAAPPNAEFVFAENAEGAGVSVVEPKAKPEVVGAGAEANAEAVCNAQDSTLVQAARTSVVRTRHI